MQAIKLAITLGSLLTPGGIAQGEWLLCQFVDCRCCQVIKSRTQGCSLNVIGLNCFSDFWDHSH